MKEQARELRKEKKKREIRGQDKEEAGHEFLILLLSSWFKTVGTLWNWSLVLKLPEYEPFRVGRIPNLTKCD